MEHLRAWFNPTPEQLTQNIATLIDLQGALNRLLQGLGPSDDEYALAPYLENYILCDRLDWCLQGDVTSHPALGSKRVATSSLYALNCRQGWARTYSRWYRLGHPSMARPENPSTKGR